MDHIDRKKMRETHVCEVRVYELEHEVEAPQLEYHFPKADDPRVPEVFECLELPQLHALRPVLEVSFDLLHRYPAGIAALLAVAGL